MRKLDDEQIERYSRQLILAEVGPRGQERLLAARVAVVGDDGAAGRVVAHLAAAGVGSIAADPSLHGCVDAAQPDVRLAALSDAARMASFGAAASPPLDAVVVSAATLAAAAALVADWSGRATTTLWIAAGCAGGCPPCPACAAALADADDVAVELAAVRATVLGTIVATETVKALLAIGTPLAGRVLAYDPATATITAREVAPRPGCDCGSIAAPRP